MPTLTPRDVYQAYPNACDTSLREPLENETAEAYLEYANELDLDMGLGDTLFLFVLRELLEDDMDISEAIRRVETAKWELDEVITRLAILNSD